MASKYWIKLYHEILDDPKMGTLSDRLWRRTVELSLLIEGGPGELPSLDVMAWKLHVDTDELFGDLENLAQQEIARFQDDQWHLTYYWPQYHDKTPDSYRRYMNSDEWSIRRGAALMRANLTCQMCGAKPLARRDLHVHHIDYDNFGNEPEEDLMVVCRQCHQGIHKGEYDGAR